MIIFLYPSSPPCLWVESMTCTLMMIVMMMRYLLCPFRMVSSRVVSLTVYGIVYHEFVFLVIFLHWFSMVLWLLSPPSNLFSEQNISSCKRFFYSLLVGWVYIFCYINLEEVSIYTEQCTLGMKYSWEKRKRSDQDADDDDVHDDCDVENFC